METTEKLYEFSLTSAEVAIVASAVKGFSEGFLEFTKKASETETGKQHEDDLDSMILELESFKSRVTKVFDEMMKDAIIDKIRSGEVTIGFADDDDCGHEECK